MFSYVLIFYTGSFLNHVYMIKSSVWGLRLKTAELIQYRATI
jgi:hypothetical protein